MIELLITNIVYVSFRILISANIVKFLNKRLTWFESVLIMAQCSFAYDFLVFWFYYGVDPTSIIDTIISNIQYTVRVLIAWYVIKKIWDWIGNYWWAVFIGAELTFITDYFIFGALFS